MIDQSWYLVEPSIIIGISPKEIFLLEWIFLRPFFDQSDGRDREGIRCGISCDPSYQYSSRSWIILSIILIFNPVATITAASHFSGLELATINPLKPATPDANAAAVDARNFARFKLTFLFLFLFIFMAFVAD
eukprot:CAMPEP_0170827666 /NCGR_PEP_ID=MMETSP0733-20121128/47386_1 /TAXON_ID=186038 /ORGANISM="Fragilariopsis kerguelensis, Strain L26-C5" /LENGTH=132 /DNA_ID=CAMNT_0011191851 /DNA_START=531 /DNA_END=926 /DNA_ORIENTATION=+